MTNVDVADIDDHNEPVRVRFDGKTLGEISRDKCNVSARECLALRALSGDGWTQRELALAFERDSRTVGRHARAECTHDLPHAPAGGSD